MSAIGRMARHTFGLATLRRTVYSLFSLASGITCFVVVVVGFSVSGGLMVTLVGLPLLWLTYLAVDALAVLDSRFLAWGAGRSIELAPHRPIRGGPFRHMWLRTIDLVTWRRSLYLLIQLGAGVVQFTVAVAMWSVAAALAFAPLADSFGDDRPEQLDGIVGEPWTAVVLWPAAFLWSALAAWSVRGCVEANTRIARALLGPTASDRRRALERQVADQSARRDQAVAASVTDRQRIERDLHDGAQARLVALAMELGRARDKLDDPDADPALARDAVAHAHEQAKEALTEVRDLARGIHPAILTDRGLDAAISSLVGASPVPVEVTVSLPERLPPTVESTAYFVIAECLTNIARHSGATHAALEVTGDASALTVEIRDDGRGGADPAAGSGLRGLADRAAAAGGILQCASPAGGPTVIRMMLPVTRSA